MVMFEKLIQRRLWKLFIAGSAIIGGTMGPNDQIKVLLRDMAKHDRYVNHVLVDQGIENAIDAANEEKRGLFDDEGGER